MLITSCTNPDFSFISFNSKFPILTCSINNTVKILENLLANTLISLLIKTDKDYFMIKM